MRQPAEIMLRVFAAQMTVCASRAGSWSSGVFVIAEDFFDDCERHAAAKVVRSRGGPPVGSIRSRAATNGARVIAALRRSAMRSIIAFSPASHRQTYQWRVALGGHPVSRAGHGWQAAGAGQVSAAKGATCQHARWPSRCAVVARPCRRRADRSLCPSQASGPARLEDLPTAENCSARKRATRDNSVAKHGRPFVAKLPSSAVLDPWTLLRYRKVGETDDFEGR
jgi:hypothetical protein